MILIRHGRATAPLAAVLVLAIGLASGEAPKPPTATSLGRHDGNVVFVAYTPDGKHLLTATYEGAVRKWDVAGGHEVQQIEKPIRLDGSTPDRRCRAAALSPDGKYLGILTYASTLNLYTMANGKPYGQLVTGADQMSGAFAVAFTPDGKGVATGRFGGREVTLWDLATGKELRKFGGGARPNEITRSGYSSLAVVGKVLASQASDGIDGQFAGATVKRWDLATGKELPPAKGPDGPSASVVFSPDGKTAAWGRSPAGAIRLWDLTTDRALKEFEGAGQARAFSPDGKLLAGRNPDRQTCLWDTASGKMLRKFGEKPTSQPLNVRADVIAFSADGKRIAAGFGTEVRQWFVASGREIRPAAEK